jgi:membrane-associated phospholipid phosphatase
MSDQRQRAGRWSPALGLAIAVAALSAAGVWVTWRVFVRTAAGQRVDDLALIGARHGRTHLWQYAQPVLDPVSTGYVVVVLVVTVGIAVLRRRWWMAVQVAVLMAGANLTTQLLKHVVLDRPDLGLWPHHGNTLPSGHTTAAASASASLLFVVGPRYRPLVAGLGALYTLGMGWSTLIGQWHRPSDVIAAVLVVTAWFAAACALMVAEPARASTATTAIPAVRARPGFGLVRGGLVVVAAGAAVVAGLLLGALWSGTGVLGTRGQLLAYAGGVAAIGAASALGLAVQLALREIAGRAAERRPPGPGSAAADAADAGSAHPAH